METRSARSEFSSARVVKGYVADALARSNDNPIRARELLVEWARDDESLRNSLLKAGAAQIVRDFFSGMRSSAASSVGDAQVIALSTSRGPSERTSIRIARKEFWEKYTLFGMKSLKMASKEELLISVKNRRDQSRGNLARADFEEKVSEKLGEDQVVKDCWTISELVQLATRCDVRA